MQNTRYYEKKNDGIYFSRLPKADQQPGNDGRICRKWEAAGKSGETYGYAVKEVDGHIESAYVDESEYGIRLCIGLQHPQGVDVVQIKLYKENGQMTQDGAGIAKKLANIDLDQPICFGTFLATQSSYEIQGRKITPCYITLKKPGGQWGINYKSIFDYNAETRSYEGLPGPEVKMVGPKEVKDFSARDAVLFAEIEKFCARVDADPNVKARKAERPQTPAETAKEESNNLPDDDLDF